MTSNVFVSFSLCLSLYHLLCLQINSEKRSSAEMMKPKPKPQKKKKKKDPNEPQKPVSAYALFFRDTQAAIKGQNPNATFGDVSKIVASMWDSLGEEQKQVQNMDIWNNRVNRGTHSSLTKAMKFVSKLMKSYKNYMYARNLQCSCETQNSLICKLLYCLWLPSN